MYTLHSTRKKLFILHWALYSTWSGLDGLFHVKHNPFCLKNTTLKTIFFF